MSEIEKSNQYERLLDDTNQLIQISDCDTFSMMYANQPARVFTNHADQPYRGEKCFKYMMGLDEQCPFCPMCQMNNTDSFVTEIDNGVQVFTVKTKRITWEGKDAFIEYATDITTTKRAQQIFESQMQMLIKSIPEAQGIFHLNLTKDQWISSNGTSHNIEKLQNMQNVDSLLDSISNFIPNENMRNKFIDKFCRESLLNAYHHGKTELVMELQSYYDDGSIRWARLSARMIMNPNTGDLECIFYGMDINDEKMYHEKMNVVQKEKEEILEKSKKDILTGVYSKKAFEQIAEDYIRACPNQEFAIIFLDLDHFKNINDTLGHLMGDKAIMDTADRLQNIFSNKDVISRFGGDEFCILVKGISENALMKKLDFMLKKLKVTYQDDKNHVSITASIGITYCRHGAKQIIPLIQEADIALYQAKRRGRNQFCLKIIDTNE